MARARKTIRKYRPSHVTITKEYIDRILSALRVGHFVDTAAALSGVPTRDFYSWLEAGRDAAETRAAGQLPLMVDNETELALHLYDSMPQAIAQAEDADVRAIMLASGEDWKAAAWMLERRFAAHWDKLRRIDPALTHTSATLTITESTDRLSGRSSQELVARAALLSQRLADTAQVMPTHTVSAQPGPYQEALALELMQRDATDADADD